MENRIDMRTHQIHNPIEMLQAFFLEYSWVGIVFEVAIVDLHSASSSRFAKREVAY